MDTIGFIDARVIESFNNAAKSIKESQNLETEDMPELTRIAVSSIHTAIAVRMVEGNNISESKFDNSSKYQDPDQLIDAEEAAGLLAFKEDYVLELARKGSLNSIRNGKYVRFRIEDIRKWISDHAQKKIKY